MFEQNLTAIFAFAQTNWTELVSVILLLVAVGVLLYYTRTSTSPREEISDTASSEEIWDSGIQETTLIKDGAGHMPSYAETEQHVVTEIVDEPQVLNIRRLTQEWNHCPVAGNVCLTETVTTEISKRTPVGVWEPRRSERLQTVTRQFSEKAPECVREPRRSERLRKATNRFRDSWYNGNLRSLGSALGVESSSR